MVDSNLIMNQLGSNMNFLSFPLNKTKNIYIESLLHWGLYQVSCFSAEILLWRLQEGQTASYSVIMSDNYIWRRA